jgi:glucan biosynthesis protein C
MITFAVRIWLPMGWNFELLNLQIPFFPQYVSMFAIGAIAYRGNWFLSMPEKTGKFWLWVAIVLALLLPVMSVLGTRNEDPSVFSGGLSWQAFLFPLWEQFFCVAIVITLLVVFREKYNHQGRFSRAMSASSYAAYILHAPIIVFLALSLRGIILNPLLKFALVAPVAVFLCFLISNYIRRLPLARRVL